MLSSSMSNIGLRLCVAVIIAMAAVGCASLDRDECLRADWQAIGYEDGVQGKSQAVIGRHRSACAGHGVTMDLAAYRSGYDDGLRQYCEPDNGYRLGERGVKPGVSCPADLASEFRAAQARGRELYLARQSLALAQQQAAHVQGELDQVRDLVKEKEAELVAEGTSRHRRRALLGEIRDLEQQIVVFAEQLMEFERTVAQKRERLLSLETAQAFREPQ